MSQAFAPAAQLEDLVGGRLSWIDAATVRVAPCVARDSEDVYTIESTLPLDADITASGAGGLDTGVVTINTLYAVHLIADSTGVSATAALLSLSVAAPLLPAGYDLFRRIGSVLTDAAADVVRFTQSYNGVVRRMDYDRNVFSGADNLSGANNTDYKAAPFTSSVPATAVVIHFLVGFKNTSGGPADVGYIRRLGATGGGTGAGSAPWRAGVGINVARANSNVSIPCASDRTIEMRVTNAADQLWLAVIGYDDEL